MKTPESKQPQRSIQRKKDVRPAPQLHPTLQLQNQAGNRAVVQMMMENTYSSDEKSKGEEDEEEDEESKTNEKKPNPIPAISVLQNILKTNEYRQLIKQAKQFCKQGGVGRILFPPQEISKLYEFLLTNESAIKPLLVALSKVNITGDNATKNLIVELANKVMDGINLVIDGVNKAEANLRAWMLDGNEAEVEGVQPARDWAINLYKLWDAASALNPGRKRATLVAPSTKRKANAARNKQRGSYSALK